MPKNSLSRAEFKLASSSNACSTPARESRQEVQCQICVNLVFHISDSEDDSETVKQNRIDKLVKN